jgi:tetratricopeptide (TPR) repeat protein
MRAILAILALALAVSAQTSPKHISLAEAEKHLLKKAQMTYPPSAAAARIQDNIILEVTIDEFGAASVRRLVKGHPMLAPAAIENVNRWKYRPFDVDGKPASVVTLIVVTFGHPWWKNDAEDRADVLIHDNFWAAEESAQTLMVKGDYAGAEQQLNKARAVLASVHDDRTHELERWQWVISMGRLAMAQQKYDVAEEYYKKAAKLRENGDKDAPEMAATLADLGRLYGEEKRYDLARDHATRSVAIYQKNFKKAGANHPGDREAHGQAIADQSWMLSKIALQTNDHIEAGQQCRMVLGFQAFLSAGDRDSFVSACEQTIRNPTPKD